MYCITNGRGSSVRPSAAAGKTEGVLGSGRASRKRKFKLGLILGSRRASRKGEKVKSWAAEEHVGKEKSVLGSGSAKRKEK
jgi:hypothetical protein